MNDPIGACTTQEFAEFLQADGPISPTLITDMDLAFGPVKRKIEYRILVMP